MRYKYEVDKFNTLTAIDGKTRLRPSGRFMVDDKNRLSYLLDEPDEWRKKYVLPRKIIFEGEWSLSPNHDLIFTLTRTRLRLNHDRLYFRSELLGAEAGSAVFALGSTKKGDMYDVSLFALKGKWQSDRYNRLNFLVQKAGSKYDTLTLEGSWTVNENNTLVYRYTKTGLKRSAKIAKTVGFEGFWQITDKYRIAYILDLEGGSYFSFKAALQTPNLRAAEGQIRYRVGIGARGNPSFGTQVITLFGEWKLSRTSGLSFEVDYGEGRAKEIRFGTQFSFTKSSEMVFQLVNSHGKDLALSVTFNKRFLNNNAEWFLRAVKERGSRVEAGVDIFW